jgi:hypothetical protein
MQAAASVVKVDVMHWTDSENETSLEGGGPAGDRTPKRSGGNPALGNQLPAQTVIDRFTTNEAADPSNGF